MRTLAQLALVSILSVTVGTAHGSEGSDTFEVTITNITRGQQFTPLLLVTHRRSVQLFRLGQPATPQLATLAEEGNVAPLKSVLDGNAAVAGTVAGSGLTDPGKSTTLRIATREGFDRLSIAAMLIPTNDAFVALNSFDLDQVGHGRRSVTVFAIAYDAGSERNDELCASIPGPSFMECGGPGGGGRVGDGEGFVHVHNGIHGVGDLTPAQRTWLNPVAVIAIRRVR